MDDEAAPRARLQRFLAEEPDAEVVGECDSGRAAIETIDALRPDLLFLDVEMPELDGFATLAQLGAMAPPVVVFVTAYDEYALRAFDVHAVDYLLKPFDRERLHLALERTRDRVEARALRARGAALADRPDAEDDPATVGRAMVDLLDELRAQRSALHALATTTAASGSQRFVERFPVRNDGRITLVRASDVDWIEAAGNYVKLHTARGVHLVRDSITSLDTRLDPGRFVRVHRSTIVNIDRIKEIQPWFSGDYVVLLHNSAERIKLSRSFRDAVLQRVGG